ncbi:MAG: hypothetical protein ACTSUE_01005 [Promethearchaeota archaeon]
MSLNLHKNWALSIGTVELNANSISVDSQIKGKDLEKKYGNQLSAASKESAGILKDLFGKRKKRQESIGLDVAAEMLTFFTAVAAEEGVSGDDPGGAPAAPAVDLDNAGYSGASSSSGSSSDGIYNESAASEDYSDDVEVESDYQIKIEEKLSLLSNREGDVLDSTVTGILKVINEGKKDVVWDIDITLDDTAKTDMDSPDIHIPELDPGEDWSKEYQVTGAGEQEFLLKVEEIIDTTPETEEPSEFFILDPESEGQDTTLKILIQNTSDSIINDVRIEKEIPDDFKDLNIVRESKGSATKDDGKITWIIEQIEGNEELELHLSLKVYPTEIKSITSGEVSIGYSLKDVTLSGIDPTFVDGLSNQMYFVDRDEREEEPDVWDCEFVFRNRSEFPMLLQKVEVTSGDENTEYETISLEPNALLKPGTNWKSEVWDLDSEDEPSFSEKIQYTVLSQVQKSLEVSKTIEPFELSILSISGEKTYDKYQLNSYRDAELTASISITTQGNLLIDKIHVEDTLPISFKVPEKDDVAIGIGGKSIDDFNLSAGNGDDLSVERKLLIDIEDYYEKNGELADGTSITVTYPVSVIKPPKDSEFAAPAEVVFVTRPTGKELKVEMETELVKVVHTRRRTRIGKAVVPLAEKDTYEIVLLFKNKGDVSKTDIKIVDFIPEGFEVLSSSMEHESEEKDGGLLLKWVIPEIQPGEEVEITYKVHGESETYSLKNIETKAFK